MLVKLLRSLGLAIGVLTIGSAAFAAAPDAETVQGMSPADPTTGMDSAIPNWSARQFLGMREGFTGSSSFTGSSNMDVAGKTTAKASFSLATFVPITPCRLVDTRTGTGGSAIPFGPANETRTYTVPGTCGIPAGSNRLTAVSLAITTPPTISSGDVSVAAFGASLTTTVAMVYAANIWNSATATPAVDSLGRFSIAVRPNPASTTHVVIDINGYYAELDAANTTDFMFLVGNYNSDGGMFYAQNTGVIGAAIRAFSGSGSDVRLAQGVNAIDIANGGIRVRGAGVNTGTVVSIHRATAANTCVLGGLARTVLNHPDLNGLPNAIPIVGAGVYAWPGGAAGGLSDWDNVNVVYYVGVATCGTTSALNKWMLYKVNATPFAIGVSYPLFVINN